MKFPEMDEILYCHNYVVNNKFHLIEKVRNLIKILPKRQTDIETKLNKSM